MAIVEIIKYNGGPDLLAWKYPNEELGTWTQLIVNESQEVVLYKDGKALDVFQSGRHTLETRNIPILNQIINLPFGGNSPFAAEVWYVNRSYLLDVKWGTPAPVQIQDPKYQIFCPVRANGIFGIQVDDSRKFLVRLVGTMPVFDRNTLIRYFRGLCISKVKDAISSYVVKKQITILEINAYINELSAYMKECIMPEMAEYGIKLVSFHVNDISVPEDDSAVKRLKDALAKKAEMNIIGYSYQQERSFNTLNEAVSHPGSSSQLLGAGMGLGMGMGIGRATGTAFAGMAQDLDISGKKGTKICPKCHASVDIDQRFCGNCGYDTGENPERGPNPERKTEIRCRGCGTQLNEKTKFCPECGKKYNPCPNCKADLEENAVSCPECGYEFPKKCPNCGAELNRSAKFCPECGFSFVKKCPGCSAVIEGNPRFCPECGEKLK